MTFEFINAKTTYQHMDTKMFYKQFSIIVKVYVDDTMIKSKKTLTI